MSGNTLWSYFLTKVLAMSQLSTSTAANEYQAAAMFFDESVVDGNQGMEQEFDDGFF